jgi:hypothetical protein
MASTRSDYQEKSSKEPDHESIKYTFAGYGEGNTCTLKTESGESVPAKIQTNGLIQPGAQVCVIKTPEGLVVRGMPTPPAPEPDLPSSISTGKIKLLWTIGVKLYLGGDRRSPLLIKAFPEGSTISGLCHNLGSGDRFVVGVIVSRPNNNGVIQYEQWVFSNSNNGVKTLADGFKSSRVRPIGYGLFADPWLPTIMIDGKFIARTKKGKLIFFSNTEAYEIASVPPIALPTPPIPLKAIVHRTEGSSYVIRIEQGSGATKTITEIKSSDIESKPKVEIKDWGFLPVDELVDDRFKNAFLDPNLTGKSSVSADRANRDLMLQTWQSNIKAVFSTVFVCTRTEQSYPPSQSRAFNLAQGKLGVGKAIPIDFSISHILDRSAIPNGNQPPPGNDLNMPYKDRYFSFVFADNSLNDRGFWGPNANPEDVWLARAFYSGNDQLMSSDAQRYSDFYVPGSEALRKYTTMEPHFQIPGVYLGKMSFLEYYRIVTDFKRLANPQNNAAAHNYPTNLAAAESALDFYRDALPEWIDRNAFDGWFYNSDNINMPQKRIPNTGIIYPIFRYLDWYGREQWRSNGLGYEDQSVLDSIKTVGWKGYSFDPEQPPDAEPSYAPYTITDHKWADPIVVSQNGEILYKRWLEMKTTGSAPTPIPELRNHAIYLKRGSIKKIEGVLPLLSAEDSLEGSKLYRVDRSPLDIAKTGTDKPPRSSVGSLNVETYSLGSVTTKSKRSEPIYVIPQNAEILSASYHS